MSFPSALCSNNCMTICYMYIIFIFKPQEHINACTDLKAVKIYGKTIVKVLLKSLQQTATYYIIIKDTQRSTYDSILLMSL